LIISKLKISNNLVLFFSKKTSFSDGNPSGSDNEDIDLENENGPDDDNNIGSRKKPSKIDQGLFSQYGMYTGTSVSEGNLESKCCQKQ